MARQKAESNMVATVKPSEITTSTVVTSGLSLRAPAKELASALATLARVADKRSTMPALANVLIRSSTDGVMLAATDLNSYLKFKTGAWFGGIGEVCVPAKQLADLVKGAPGTDATVSTVGANGARFESGSMSTALIGIHARDFPRFPDATEYAFESVDGKRFAAAMESVAFSVCKDETRFHLAGIKLERYDGGMRAISTDGHRLTLWQGDIGGTFPSAGVIVPAKAATEIAKLIKAEKGAAVQIAVKAPYLVVKVGAWEYAAKTIDAQFPPYWQVIPKNHSKLATVDRKALLAILKRAKQLSSDTRGVKLDVYTADGTLRVTADHPDKGTMSESLACDCSKPMTIGVNPKYLIELLDECDGDHVTLAFGAELDPIVVRSMTHATGHAVHESPFIGVVMPMRI